MMKRDDGDDDFVTKTAKHRKKHTTNGSSGATPEDPGSSSKAEKHTTATEGKPPAGPGAANASTSASGEGISLRPRTMFAMKGRGRTESEGSAYRPQWSKDGEGFVTAATSNASAGQGKDANAAQDPQGAADASRRKSKVLRYTKEELLALHFTTTSPPEFPPETLVACDLALPPVSTLPFDYEEIYKQWALNRNRGRGRGRGTGTGNSADGQQQSDRSRSNGKWEEGGNKTTKNDSDEQQSQGNGDSTWQRGFKVTESSSGSRDDVWDDVGALGGSDSNEMDLSSMAEAAERFRREMDAMREELNPPILKDNNNDLDEFDKKLESAAAAGQFEDSDEEVQWDDPTDLGSGLGGDHGSLFFEDASTTKSQFGIIDTKQFPLVEEKSFSLQQLGGEPLSNLESLRVEVRDEWFYLDPQGLQQGPFKSIEMREWFEAGYFKPHLPIRFGREEQRELRKKMEETSNSTNLEQMGAQLKMMLGVQSLAAPSPPQSQPPAAAAPSSSGGGASPWGVPATTAQPTIASKQSLRDILAEEERLAQERARKNEGSTSSSSHWVNVVAGTSATPAPKPVRSSLGPVPVSVLKSRQQIRATNGADSAAPKTSPTPTKVESDASFWNFGAAQTAKANSSGSAATGEVKVSNAFGNTAVSSEFMTWAAKQFQAISGREDLTLMEYCASLEDPGEIREYLAAYLGSTPRVSAFATEFIQRKKKGPPFSSSLGPSLKKSPSSASAKSQDDDASTGKKGKRRGGKGQKIDPSLLNFV
uniref:GYF domain-containing protein n=1 Tax=Globisporangium ultimum (strain ATCC 200006 / CBS 805.95 / DAOM BR144) TaxID=431595 RepID=K3X4C5_GLOUD